MANALRAVDIIMKKRGNPANPGGEALSREELSFLIGGFVDGSIANYQIAAWLMAVFFNGMTFEETGLLTDIMLHSGDVIDLHGYEDIGLTGPFVDKHSTGGVGDKISLPLAPIAAACGVQVPMMSGRALGHTGGTLDKLESIEGYKTTLTADEFRRLIAKTGFAMTGQSKQIVPADRLLYALRDVTGTVESVPLITGSILSKKVAEGSDALVFDVKCGSGAFMKTERDAATLAEFLVRTAQAMGRKASALITDMDAPLGNTVGNFLEIEETLDCLEGRGPADIMELTYALGAHMLMIAGTAGSKEEAENKCRRAVSSGKAMELFLQNVADQGGSPGLLLSQRGKRRSRHTCQIRAERDGWLTLDAFKVGLAGVHLGVGRNRTEDSVCPDAGIVFHAHEGEKVRNGQLIMDVYGKDESCLPSAAAVLEQAVGYAESEPSKKKLIYREISQ